MADPRKPGTRSKGPKRRRSPPLTGERIGSIVSIIQAHKEKLTWEGLCEKVARETGDRYTRQALNKYAPIKIAYSNQAAQNNLVLPNAKRRKENPKIAILERKLADAEAVRDFLIEKLVRWAVNASTRNLTEEFLDQPLPSIDRAKRR